MNRRSWLKGLAAATAAAALASCSAGGDGASRAGEGSTTSTTLRAAFQGDIGSFDPDNNFEVAALGAIKGVYEGLVDYKPGTTEVVPRLAASYEVSADQLTYTFTLRDGVTFHDGTPMTSASVKASFERRADPAFLLSYFVANVKSTAAPDPLTFVVTLSAPQPSFLDNLASPWGPKVVGPDALVTNKGTDRSGKYLADHADGTGPFKLTTFSRGERYVLDRFDGYWGTKASFAQVQFAVIPDIGQQTLQLRNGELDVVLHGYPYAQLAALPEGLTATSYNDLGVELAFVNTKRSLTTLERRTRVMAAIDPASWVTNVFGEHGKPALSLFPRAMLVPAEPYAWPTAATDVEVPPLEIAYAAEEAGGQQRVADTLIVKLSEKGIKATARAIPGSQFAAFKEAPEKAPDLVLAQNNPDSAHPDSQTSLFYATGAPLNIFDSSNPEADKAFADAAQETDKTKRDALYADAARIVFDDGLFLPLADLDDVIVHRKGLTDFSTRPDVPWNIDLSTVRWQ